MGPKQVFFTKRAQDFELLNKFLSPHNINILADLIFVKKFTRPNFRAKEFYTPKTRKLRPFLPAIKQHKCIIITNLVLCWLKYKKMCKFINSYEESLH